VVVVVSAQGHEDLAEEVVLELEGVAERESLEHLHALVDAGLVELRDQREDLVLQELDLVRARLEVALRDEVRLVVDFVEDRQDVRSHSEGVVEVGVVDVVHHRLDVARQQDVLQVDYELYQAVLPDYLERPLPVDVRNRQVFLEQFEEQTEGRNVDVYGDVERVEFFHRPIFELQILRRHREQLRQKSRQLKVVGTVCCRRDS
jgi:DNA-binding transcriptional ArsR family regulator